MARDGTEGHGGDPLIARERRIRALIQYELRGAVRTFVDRLDLTTTQDDALKARLARLSPLPLVHEDVDAAEYQFKKQCRDHRGRSVPAAAKPLDRTGPICFDLKLLARMNVGARELVGLAVHEHGHHFGIEDEDHALMSFATERAFFPDASQGNGTYSSVRNRFERTLMIDRSTIDRCESNLTHSASEPWNANCQVQLHPNLGAPVVREIARIPLSLPDDAAFFSRNRSCVRQTVRPRGNHRPGSREWNPEVVLSATANGIQVTAEDIPWCEGGRYIREALESLLDGRGTYPATVRYESQTQVPEGDPTRRYALETTRARRTLVIDGEVTRGCVSSLTYEYGAPTHGECEVTLFKDNGAPTRSLILSLSLEDLPKQVDMMSDRTCVDFTTRLEPQPLRGWKPKVTFHATSRGLKIDARDLPSCRAPRYIQQAFEDLLKQSGKNRVTADLEYEATTEVPL